jgi:hypothetical protein
MSNPRHFSSTAARSLAGALCGLLLASARVIGAPDLSWQDLHDGGGGSADFGSAALCDPAGNLVVGGESADGIDGSDVLIRKLARETGALLWSRRVSDSPEINDVALSQLACDRSGNVLVGGYVRGCG